MNTSILRTLLTLSLSAIGSVSLLAQGPIHATVPFDFTVGSKSFAAGEYTVQEVAPSVLSIRSADANSVALTIASNGGPNKAGTTTLTFDRVGERYFLSGVSGANRGWELPKPAADKKLAANRASSGQVSVTAVALK